MAEDKPCKRSVPQLSCFSVEGIGDGDKNSAPGGSTISACEAELEEGDVSTADSETVKNAQHLSGDQSCKRFWPLPNTDDVMRLLLEDSRHEHEAFTSKLKFLSDNRACLNTSEPQPLSRIEFPRSETLRGNCDDKMERYELIGFSSDCHLKGNLTEDDDDDFCILLSPRTICRKLTAEPKIKDGDDLASKINIPTSWNCKTAAESSIDCNEILKSAVEVSEAPQLFEIDMNEDRTLQPDSVKQSPPPPPQSDNPDAQVSLTSSIYHAANTESFMTNAFSSLEASPSSSHASVVSGLDSNSLQFNQELNKCQGMTLTIEYNDEFDGDFECEHGPLEMDVVWASNRVFSDDDGNRRITIPENDAPDSPAEGDNDLFANLNFITSQQETGLDQASLERSLSKYLNDPENQSETMNSDEGNAEIRSSLDIGDNVLSDNDDAISVLTSSSAIDNESDSEQGSVYDLDYMGRNDIFWPMMTPSERKMLGAPSTLNITESEPFEVEETSGNVDFEKTSASTDSTAADDNMQMDSEGNQRRHEMTCHSSTDGSDNLARENKADLQEFSTFNNVSGSGDDAEVK